MPRSSQCSRSCLAVALVLAAVFLPAAASPVRAASNSDARLAIHLLPRTAKNACTRTDATPVCQNIVARGQLYPSTYFAYLLATDVVAPTGLAGIQCGIQYNASAGVGVDVFSWTNCATLEFLSTGWPASGGGNLITWDPSTRCQRFEPGGTGTGVVAAAGYFYVAAYTADQLAVTVRPIDGRAKVADCSNVEYTIQGGGVLPNPSALGYAAFSAGAISPGYVPCAPPPAIDCTIAGPGSAFTNQAGLVFSAPNAPAGAAYQWSVIGGSIQGASTGGTATVTAGGAGTMTVSVTISQAIGSSTCQKSVSVVAPTCSISGRDPAYAGILTGYAAGTNLPSPAVHWTVSGNATWDGIVQFGGIYVTPGPVDGGPFTLQVDLTAAGGATSCSRTINVVTEPAPTCTITGAAGVTEGSQLNSYTLTPGAGVLQDVAWSISGNGTITSGLTNALVQVQAGDVGGFELTAVFHTDASTLAGSCTKSVTVNPLTCDIVGPGTVAANLTNFGYSTGPGLVGATYAWSVSGNATIVAGATDPAVILNVGAIGSFQLSVQITRAGVTHSCSRTISVVAPGNCNHLNANAKIMVHLLPKKTKNACGARSRPTCNAMLTAGALYPTLYYAYLVVADGNASIGVGGAECGIAYDPGAHSGVDVFQWTSCATVEIPAAGWPASGGGTRLSFDNLTACQRSEPGGVATGVVGALGYFYLGAYSPDFLSVVPHPITRKTRVMDCAGCEELVGGDGYPTSVASHMGSVRFGGGNGYNPCGWYYPVIPTTWSGIKAMYAPGGAAPTSTRRDGP